MSSRPDPREVYRRLRRAVELGRQRFTTLEAGQNIFAKAVATILSQNTNDENSIAAYQELSRKVEVTPESMLRISIEELENLIRRAGLQRQKARAIKNLAKKVVEDLGGDLARLGEMDTERAREWLLGIEGIGKKTADIILINLGHPTFPVDTHISRITCRLGITDSRRYDEVSRAWIEALDPSQYHDAHLRLIAFGRTVCTSRSPRCGDCVLNDICRYYSEDGQGCKA